VETLEKAYLIATLLERYENEIADIIKYEKDLENVEWTTA
jgi:hypothetical protein